MSGFLSSDGPRRLIPRADDAPASLAHRVAAATDRAHGVLAPGVLSRDEAEALVARALRLRKADAMRVTIDARREANVRFADNQMSTSGASANTTIRIQSVFGKRKASVVTNDRSDAGLASAVARAEALARLAPEDPEYLGELGAQTYVAVPGWSDATATLGAEDRARAALAALEPARAAQILDDFDRGLDHGRTAASTCMIHPFSPLR